jgi:hypothetical protein
MAHSLPYFYGSLRKVKTVESAIGGEAMKDFLKWALLTGSVLALVLGVRVAVFLPQHLETVSVKDPAPIAAADGGCAVTAVKMHCSRDANPESQAMASGPRQGGSARADDSQTIEEQNMRCAARQVRIPCLQQTDRRS